MPHATSATGFQAFILCGPGASLDTFTSSPKDFPKALVPIANRPMVWYALDWCYRMGVTEIYIITPADASAALSTALVQNPYLTSLPAPKPTLIAPDDVDLTTGTAELFRNPSVQDAITSDFIVLPCDIICELPGSSLLELWMTLQGSLGGAYNPLGEKAGRRGALAVHYQTKNVEEGGLGVKKEETDFIATTPLASLSSLPSVEDSLRSMVESLAMTMPTDTLKDIIEEKQYLPLRHALLRKHGNIKLRTTFRDAHVYLFPHWVKDFIRENETFESISEDVLGWWAKAGWQDGLAEKLALPQVLSKMTRSSSHSNPASSEDFNLADMSSTSTGQQNIPPSAQGIPPFASRVRDPFSPTTASTHTASLPITALPKVMSYIHRSLPSSPTIRRVDTIPLLLSLSLHLAKLPSVEECAAAGQTPSPLAHTAKVHSTSPVPQRATVTRADTLVDVNVSIAEKSSIKECVIGPNCEVQSLARLTRCLLMDGVIIEEGAMLVGCVLGRRCKIGKGVELKDCQVQDGFVIEAGVVGKGETYKAFEGLSDDEDVLMDGNEQAMDFRDA